METAELRNILATHLNTLKRNLDAVPLEVLKSQYKKPFNTLCRDISSSASAYARQAALGGIHVRKDFADEAALFVESAIQQSGLPKQISAAAFRRQDIKEIDTLVSAMRSLALDVLGPFFSQPMGIYVDAAMPGNPG